LSWLHKHSKGDVKVLYTTKKYDVQVTSTQMAVLLLYNTIEGNSLTFESIQSSTNIEESILKLALQVNEKHTVAILILDFSH
jgi:cullin 3